MPPPKRIMVSASDVAVDKRLYVSRQSESVVKSAYVSVTTINIDQQYIPHQNLPKQAIL